jgi:uncharacterized membrane protein (DUF373 family)
MGPGISDAAGGTLSGKEIGGEEGVSSCGGDMMDEKQQESIHPARARVVSALSLVEDAIYVGLGILLSVFAVTLLVRGFRDFVQVVYAQASSAQYVNLLDQILLVLLVVELLYTVQVSFRDRGLVTEPFLVVALISVIRRVLVLTAQIPELAQAGADGFRHAVMELSLLALMIVVLVGSLIFMQRQAKGAAVPTVTRQ